MTELELREIFKDESDCHAHTVNGAVILAMTEDKFIEVLMNAKMKDNLSERPNVCFQVKCTYCRNDECHISETDNQLIRKMMDECIHRKTKK